MKLILLLCGLTFMPCDIEPKQSVEITEHFESFELTGRKSQRTLAPSYTRSSKIKKRSSRARRLLLESLERKSRSKK